MDDVRLDSLLDLFHGPGLILGLLWLGLIFLIVALLVMMYTRWGAMKPLRKCLALSVAAHLLLTAYSTTVYVAPAIPFLRDQIIQVSLSEKPPERRGAGRTSADVKAGAGRPVLDARPWETFAGAKGPAIDPIAPPRAPDRALPPPQRSTLAASGDLTGPPPLLDQPLMVIPAPTAAPIRPESPAPKPTAEKPVEAIQAPAAQSREGARAGVPNQPKLERLTPIDRSARSPTRTTNEKVPSSLLERPLSMPRLTDVPAKAEPGKSLTTVSDVPSTKAPARPAEPAATSRGPSKETQPGASTALSDPAPGGPSPSPLLTSRLKPPSLAEDEGSVSMAGPGSQTGPGTGLASLGPPQLPRNSSSPGDYQVPEVYRMRLAPNRAQLSERLGATPELETAVKAGLKWLADHQEPDGRWNPRRHEGGREIMEAGRDRQGAGGRADTGITALAILAFAASGNTHLDGAHRISVRRGIEFLLSAQSSDGALGGEAQLYEFMYCHGMATLAMSELAGMTGDAKLRRPLQRAVAYTLAAQDPSGGGWRYRPREAGDMSQFGWQIMSLKSASLAGVAIPESAWRGAQRFLDSASGGRHHGLAAYRPGEDFTRSMTAEALACRQFLGLTRDSPTAREAGDLLLGELPGYGEPNLYFWYYGSIAMYQLQGDYWKRWSESLRITLLATQRTAGTLAGSWDPNTRWDGYGGRVYSTALATLCLEAHYRFLPLNAPAKP
jgi:hypothetical protein